MPEAPHRAPDADHRGPGSRAVRLAQEIHDGPAQALSNAIFQAEYIERVAPTDPTTAAAEMRTLRELLRRELANVRDFISQLRPPVLDELGLDGPSGNRWAACARPTDRRSRPT